MSKSWGTISYSKHKLWAQDGEGKQIYYSLENPKIQEISNSKESKKKRYKKTLNESKENMQAKEWSFELSPLQMYLLQV